MASQSLSLVGLRNTVSLSRVCCIPSWLICGTAERTRLFVCLGGDKEEGDDGQDLRRTESDSGLKKACFPKMHYDLLGTALWFHGLWNASTLISFWIPDSLFCFPLDLKRKAHVRAHGAVRSPCLTGPWRLGLEPRVYSHSSARPCRTSFVKRFV